MVEEAEPSFPRRIGRYEILGFLASGGMAEIFLGCLRGPMGVDRPVVIKRILPHLARQRAFVDMFLDEARIVAGIRHPNVVDVLELGHEHGELFLVMEYLEGESVGGVSRRLGARGETMNPSLAAYVSAQACAGLHAAHELTDSEGKKRDLVHRDVSPQNIFVTYKGAVTVLDFGIATSADRVARTETGVVKGKHEYMSPEQWRGERLDRRSDIFSLGIVLYELSTGRRLFKRPGQMLIMKAICDEPILPPSTLVQAYPEALERVVMRALARRREDRYASCADMRRDLGAVLRDLHAETPEDDLARLMERIFADRIEEKTEMLRGVGAPSGVSRLVAAEADAGFELPSIDTSATNTTTVIDTPGRRGPPARIALAGVIVCSALGLAYAWRLTHAPVPPAAPVVEHATVSAPSSPPPDGSARTVSLYVESSTGTRVSIDGRDIGPTPLEMRIPLSETPVRLELRKDGYVTLVESVVPNVDLRLRLPLSPSPRVVRPARPRSPLPSAASGPTPSASPASTSFRPW
jgi:serine/threonine-protein kinase